MTLCFPPGPDTKLQPSPSPPSICMENKRGFKVCIANDWGFCAERLQSFKGLLLFRSLMYLEPFLLTGCPLQVL